VNKESGQSEVEVKLQTSLAIIVGKGVWVNWRSCTGIRKERGMVHVG